MSHFALATILPYPKLQRMPRWTFVLGILIFAALFVFLNVGRWLVVEDRLEKSAAIAVLSGRMPDRALEAARIYRPFGSHIQPSQARR